MMRGEGRRWREGDERIRHPRRDSRWIPVDIGHPLPHAVLFPAYLGDIFPHPRFCVSHVSHDFIPYFPLSLPILRGDQLISDVVYGHKNGSVVLSADAAAASTHSVLLGLLLRHEETQDLFDQLEDFLVLL